MTNSEKYINVERQLLSVVQEYTPTASEFRKIVREYNAEKIVNQKQAIKSLVEILFDGLNYGNWPWVVFKTK